MSKNSEKECKSGCCGAPADAVAGEPVKAEEAVQTIELAPAADVFESRDGVTVELEVPGARSETVDVEVKNRVLCVTARSRLLRGDRQIVYKRAFQLSDAVDYENVTASVADGILTIELPKSEHAKVHKIKVN